MEYTITSAPTPAMAPTESASRPENVPEKFWDAEKGSVNTEALLASYTALESKLGAPKADEQAPNEDEQAPNEDEKAAEEAAKSEDEKVDQIVNEAGLDVSAIETQWLENGTIPEAELAKLDKIGITKEDAEEYIAFRQSKGERESLVAMETVGGAEVVSKMVEWAGTVYSEEKAKVFNDMVNSKDKQQIEIALKSLKADYDLANPAPKPRPKFMTPESGNKTGGDSYQSLDQLLRDQANPLYRSDPAFRNAVIAKLSRSNI